MKQYFVTYSGSLFIEAENEEEACELAASQISLNEINAYEVDDDGNIDMWNYREMWQYGKHG